MMCAYVCLSKPTTAPWTPVPPLPQPTLTSESPEVSVDSDAALGGTGLPEISVTGASGERMPNGESLRPLRHDGRSLPDPDALGMPSEVSADSSTRGQEVRRQKSVRRMVESEGSGLASTGRSQH